MSLGSTTPTLIALSETGISQNQPRSGRVTMRMSPARRPASRGTPSNHACTATFRSSGSYDRPARRLARKPARPEASTTAAAFASRISPFKE
jgi:hypothetical protein